MWLVAHESWQFVCDYDIILFQLIAPNIVQFPEETHAVEGEGVLFQVKATGAPMPKLTWYHNGEVVLADYSREVAKDGTLTLPSVEIRHSGVYTLVAENPTGRREREVKLYVEENHAQQEPASARSASAIAVAYFGDHVERNHDKNNQGFLKEYEVYCCVVCFWWC